MKVVKKRLRKKKRTGEFREFGFKAGFRFSKRLGRHARNELLDRFIEKAVEANGLQFGGGGGDDEWHGFLALNHPRGSTDETHRQAVEKWFIQEPDILAYYVSSMIDAWYGDLENSDCFWTEKTSGQRGKSAVFMPAMSARSGSSRKTGEDAMRADRKTLRPMPASPKTARATLRVCTCPDSGGDAIRLHACPRK